MPTITVTMTTIDRSTGMLRAVWTLDDERKNPPFWLVWTEVLSSFGTQVKSTGVHEPFWRHWLSTRRVRLAEKKIESKFTKFWHCAVVELTTLNYFLKKDIFVMAGFVAKNINEWHLSSGRKLGYFTRFLWQKLFWNEVPRWLLYFKRQNCWIHMDKYVKSIQKCIYNVSFLNTPFDDLGEN